MSNELSVLVDVRVSPDSPELVLVRQTLAVVDGELRLMGEQAESRVALRVRRITAEAELVREGRPGWALAVRVTNAGSDPVRVGPVVFECREEPARNGAAHRGGAAVPAWCSDFLPKQGKRNSPLAAGGHAEWVLPFDFGADPLWNAFPLPAEWYKVVIYSGREALGEVPGGQLRPLFDRAEADPEPHIRGALRGVLGTLPPETRGRIDEELRGLRQTPLEGWDRFPALDAVGDARYLLTVPPDYRVLLRRFPRGGIEVVDVARIAAPVSVPVAVGA